MVSIAKVIAVLVALVGTNPASDLIDQCKVLGMKQQQYFDMGVDNTLPPFDAGYRFVYTTDDKVGATLEILVRNSSVLQAGVQIVYPPTTSEKLVLRHYAEVKRLAVDYYGPATVLSFSGLEILNWRNRTTLFYLHRVFVNGCHSITFRTGNRKFWD